MTNDIAIAFTTGSNSEGYSLRSVGIEFSVVSNLNSSSLTASIHTASGGSPGSSLGTLTNPAFTNSGSDQVLTFTSTGIDLSANTTYFLLVDMSSSEAGSSLRTTPSDNEDSGHLVGWSIGDTVSFRGWNSTGAWTADPSSLKFSLGGIVKTATPITPPSAGLVLSRPALTVMGGGMTSYTVRLAAAPTGAVTVGIASDNADVTVSPSSLTFTAGNWENAQIVTVSAVADGDGVVDTSVLTHTGSGGGYDGISGTVDVAVSESNGAVPSNCQTGPWYDGRGRNPLHKGCIWLSAPSGAVAEGAAVPFTIHAHPAPTEDIEVDLVVFDALFRSDADGYFPDYVRGRDEGRKRLVIGTGMSSVTHMVPTVDDGLYDAPGSVRAKIWGGARTVRKHGRPSRETYPYFNRGREQSVEVTNDDSKASAYVSPEVYVSAEHRYPRFPDRRRLREGLAFGMRFSGRR